jgi:hypothetical protein
MVVVGPRLEARRRRPEAGSRTSDVNLAPAEADLQNHERRSARGLAAAVSSEVEELHVAQDDAESRSGPERGQAADGAGRSDGAALDGTSTRGRAPASAARTTDPAEGASRATKGVPAKGGRKAAQAKRAKTTTAASDPADAPPRSVGDARPAASSGGQPSADAAPATPPASSPASSRERAEPAPAARTQTRTTATASPDAGTARVRPPSDADASRPAPRPQARPDQGPAEEPPHGVRAIAFIVQRPQPYVAPGRSAQNHWRLVASLAILGLLAGVVLGYLKSPTYTAETRLVVGKTAQLSNLASVPGLDAAGQSLAGTYSRLVSTDAVRSSTAKRLGGSLDGGLSASPIPRSPVILVEGSASTPEQAADIADAGSRALVEAVNTLNQEQSASAEALLNQYEETDRELLVAQANLDTLRQQLSGASGTALDNIQKQINLAQSQVDGLQVQLAALSSAYNGVYNPAKINTQVVQRVGDAEQTGSNRTRTIELGALVGLVAGALIGLGLAVWLDVQARKHA